MILSTSAAAAPPPCLCNTNTHHSYNLLLFPKNKPHQTFFPHKPIALCNAFNTLRHVNSTNNADDQERDHDGAGMVTSASAVASAIRKVSSSPVEFVQMVEDRDRKGSLVLPSSDFQRLCMEQLELFQRIVDPDALLSVYVRPAGSYVMDRLELRRVICYPGPSTTDIVILVGTFTVPAGLRAAEAAISNQQVQMIPEHKAILFPMVKHPFVVGFLVAELPVMELNTRGGPDEQQQSIIKYPSPEEAYSLWPKVDRKSWEIEIQPVEDEPLSMCKFTAEQRSNAISISRSLAVAYVMDQKALLLQQSSWQNNIRMSSLAEQIRGPLSSIRTLSKMLSVHMQRSEVASDIIEDILAQGDRAKDALQQLQDAVYLTKANIVRYNEETLKRMHDSPDNHLESGRPQLPLEFSKDTATMDLEMPMPPLALAPLRQNEIRSCHVSDVLEDLTDAARPLAHQQERLLEFTVIRETMQVAVEEHALRQALSNLIEGALLRTDVGGKVQIVSTGAPAGGALVLIDDDGPDMQYMTQIRSLTPFGAQLLSENMVQDNMTWNFVAGLTIAREILESYGCVVRVISPRMRDAVLGAGGTRVEIWLPFAALTDPNVATQDM